MPPPKFKLALDVPEESERAPCINIEASDGPAAAPGLCDSWKFNATGSLTVMSKSYNPYQFSQEGLIKANGTLSYKVSERDIITIKTLGRGASATVYKGFMHEKGQFVAVKKINIFEKELRNQMMNDVKALCDATNTPGLISFHGAFHNPDSGQISIVLEYMDGGSLADVLAKVGRIPEDVLSKITSKVLQGLAFLHKKHMVHRDIKPANILMNSAGEPKISDFGISAFIDSTLAQCHTFTGTVTYMSPERIHNTPYSFAADIWSLGLVLIECATGKYPYDATGGPLELMIQVMQEEAPLPSLESGASPELRDFVDQCLRKDPLRRPSAEMLLRHPFAMKHLNAPGGVDLMKFMKPCTFDPLEKMDEIAFIFCWSYYSFMSGGVDGIRNLANLYAQTSVYDHDGERAVGRRAIMERLHGVASMYAAFGKMAYKTKHIDCQPYMNDRDILVLVEGTIQLEAGGDGSCTKFSESFVLVQATTEEYFVANQAFRLL